MFIFPLVKFTKASSKTTTCIIQVLSYLTMVASGHYTGDLILCIKYCQLFSSGPRCVARFDFEGEHSDELTFSEGDVIQLKEYVGDEWARGKIGASAGIFPLNFVEIIEDLPAPPSQQQTKPTRIALPGETQSSLTHLGLNFVKH